MPRESDELEKANAFRAVRTGHGGQRETRASKRHKLWQVLTELTLRHSESRNNAFPYNLEKQKAGLMEEGMLVQNCQGEDIRKEVDFPGQENPRTQSYWTVVQGADGHMVLQEWRGSEEESGGWGAVEDRRWRACWVMCGGLDFIWEGMWPLKGFLAGKSDINVIIITASSHIAWVHHLPCAKKCWSLSLTTTLGGRQNHHAHLTPTKSRSPKGVVYLHYHSQEAQKIGLESRSSRHWRFGS